MATKTKSGGGTLALVVALIVGAAFFYGLVKRDPSDERSGVLLTVTFQTNIITNPNRPFVDIIVLVDGVVKFL